MKKTSVKTKISITTLILVLTFSVMFVALPVTAQGVTVNPVPYINAVPNPVEVNKPSILINSLIVPKR